MAAMAAAPSAWLPPRRALSAAGAGRAPRAQVDLGGGTGCHDIWALPAAHRAHVHGDAGAEVGERVQRGHLLRQVPDGAGAPLPLGPGAGRLAPDIQLDG